jgi:ATP-dependent protease ClpP protease subunit
MCVLLRVSLPNMKNSILKTMVFLLGLLALNSNLLANEGRLTARVLEKKGHYYYDLSHYSFPNKQVVLFDGGFGKVPFDKAEEFLKNIEKEKDVHLYIGRGFGGSVSQHKNFIKTIKRACKKSFISKKTCEVYTYLDGQCSSMCITLFLSGDKRYARDHWFANLGFHRTVWEFNGRHIPVQSVNSMARYFKAFDDVNDEYIDRNKHIIFGQPNNGLYQSHGQELLDAGFAHELTEKLTGSHKDFLENFHNLN